MSLYGKPSLRLEHDETDRVGLLTTVHSRMWVPSAWPISQEQYFAEMPSVPDMGSNMEFIGRRTVSVGGALRTYWVHTGIAGGTKGKDVSYKTRGNSLDYKFDPGYAQISIALHPKIQSLLDTYAGRAIDGQIQFPPTFNPQTGTSGHGFSQGGTDEKPNPMFGHDTFLAAEGTYSYRYVTPSLAGIYAGSGKLATSLPGEPPSLSEIGQGYSWFKPMPQWQRRGPVFEVLELYWAGQWPEALYGSGSTTAPGFGVGVQGVADGPSIIFNFQ